ncbi:ATPase [Anopheles sinensis]|uniref:ATPase n=1 Tax=Anopheles sinensis TaxID=74873 RepID=A0A084VZH9_ANOSI|nr:ATPase [Anopheles sinensis]
MVQRPWAWEADIESGSEIHNRFSGPTLHRPQSLPLCNWYRQTFPCKSSPVELVPELLGKGGWRSLDDSPGFRVPVWKASCSLAVQIVYRMVLERNVTPTRHDDYSVTSLARPGFATLLGVVAFQTTSATWQRHGV